MLQSHQRIANNWNHTVVHQTKQPLIIPQYPCNGGMDTKFQTEPREVSGYQHWRDVLTPTEFTQSIEQINIALKPSRAGRISILCLATGSLLFPLIPFAILTMRRKKLRKKILKRAIGVARQSVVKNEMAEKTSLSIGY
tara:strand:+ start:1187 stop:1603 length:417 start_codon:yes stop_codon:yes gene_type:complete